MTRSLRPPAQNARARSTRRVLGLALLVLVLGLAPGAAQNVIPAAPATEASPLAAAAEGANTTHAAPAQALQHRGSGEFTAPPPAPPVVAPPAPDTPRLDLMFERAPVALVVQTLLADFAHASVVIDPRVQGEITIISRGQITAGEIPLFLRANVGALGLELVEQAPNAFLLRPALTAEAQGAEVFRPGANLRSGMVIYGLRYVSAAEMSRLLQPFARQGVAVQPERTRELLILTGPPDQIATLVRTIELLDVDWLQGMSFGIVALEYANPDTLIGEVRTLFGGTEGPIGSMVEFVAMPGRRAILILAKRPDRLDQARTWITQLDRPLTASGRIRLIEIANTDAEQIAATLQGLFSDGQADIRIIADARRNALLIQSDPATFEEVAGLVRELDRPTDQVMIEVTIAEVALNNDFRFGVQWNFDLRDGTRAILSEASNGAMVARFPGFSATYTGSYVQATLNTLSSRTNVEVISSPVVVTLDNQAAVLQVGDEVPIVTQSATNVTTTDAAVVNTVQYRETGILLRVTPRIGANDTVTLEVAQEASEVAATTTSGIDSPTIQQRRFESTISVGNGETIALGGLIRANRTRGRAGVPFLSAVPLVGAVFGNNNQAVRRTELIVFLTPRILRSPSDASAASEEFRLRLERIRGSAFIQRTLD